MAKQRRTQSNVPAKGGADFADLPETADGRELTPVMAGEAALESRQAQEVQAAMVVAKRFPRDPHESFRRIMQSCQRKKLAEAAIYEYPRGGTMVTGPSIRLAEALAQAWGNIDCGVIELRQRRDESDVMAYCWDLETNTRTTKTFTVPHYRYTRREGKKRLHDPRDIYEHVANQAARRLRACILGVIPGDVVDEAVKKCEETLAGQSDEPLADRVRKMVAAFADQGVTAEMIEARLGHKLAATTETELVTLRKVFQSIKDGMASREQFFDQVPDDQDEAEGTRTESLTKKIKEGQAETKAEPEQEPEEPDDDDFEDEPAPEHPQEQGGADGGKAEADELGPKDLAAGPSPQNGAHCPHCNKTETFQMAEDGSAVCLGCGSHVQDVGLLF